MAQQAVQSAHAAIDFVIKYPTKSKSWHEESNYLVILSVKSKEQLESILVSLEDTDLSFAPFYEPDLNNQLTAVAIEPGEQSKKFCSRFRLAFRNKVRDENT